MEKVQLDGQLEALNKLAGQKGNRPSQSYPDSFIEWYEQAKECNSPDTTRFLLYYIYQPLYDWLMNDQLDRRQSNANLRPVVYKAWKKVCEVSQLYLSKYYLGHHEVSLLADLAEELKPVCQLMVSENYYTKRRNCDNNQIYPHTINKFLIDFINYYERTPEFTPTIILGCACGGSEIAFALAGITGLPLKFVRFSKRRDDEQVHCLKEEEEEIQSMIKDRQVLVVEDFVDYAISISKIIKWVSEHTNNIYGTANIFAYSNYSEKDLKVLKYEEENGFNLMTR